MRSEVLVVASVGRRPRIESRGALAVRQTGPETVHLVSAAATPLGGDSCVVRIVVEPGAMLRVRSVAATIALPGRDTRDSNAEWDCEVAGELDVDPEPTIVAADARHFSQTRVRLAERGRISLRERVQIGRAGEDRGFWSGGLVADIGTRPLLRHRVELGAGSVLDDEIGGPRAQVGEFRYPDAESSSPGLTLALAAGGLPVELAGRPPAAAMRVAARQLR